MSSPVLVSQKLLDLFTALRSVNEGHRITRLAWSNENIFGILRNDTLCLHKEDGLLYAWTISVGDMEAQDWYLI